MITSPLMTQNMLTILVNSMIFEGCPLTEDEITELLEIEYYLCIETGDLYD